jgi:TonB-linked SusC/RagA family outer membrane protein
MKKLLHFGFLLFCAVYTSITVAYGQARTVTGRVTGPDGTELPGVNVVIQGTTLGTNTAVDGTYSIDVPGPNAVLVFSFIGMQNREVIVGDQTTVNVRLADDARALGEVVVTALGEVRERRALGFSVTEIQTEEITQARAPNIVNSLAGKVAGVRIQGANGMTGAGANIFIRGFTTFTGTNQPLFVVDGIPIDNAGGARPAGVSGTTAGGAAALQQGVTPSNRALDINPDDIESISVLKGPAAAVLYGSRAAAGAIIITTKRGAARPDRRQTINFTSSYQASEVNRFPDYQNVYGQGNRGAFNPEAITSWGPRAEGQMVTNFRGEQEPLTIYPDNVRDLFRTGHQFMNNISFSGGTDRSNYFLSYGNLNDRGILDNNLLNRHTLTFNGGTQLTDKLRSSVSVMYSNNQSQRTQQGNQLANPFFRTWFLPRSFDVTRYPFQTPEGLQQRPTGTGAARYNPSNTWYGVDDNPLWTIRHNTYNDAINRVIGNISFGYDFNDWLTFDYRIGTDAYTEEIKRVNQRTSSGGAAFGGVGAISNEVTNRRETSSYANLTFNRRLSENFGLRLLVGNEINERRLNYTATTGNNIQIPGFDNISNTLNYQPFESTIINRITGISFIWALPAATTTPLPLAQINGPTFILPLPPVLYLRMPFQTCRTTC